MKYKTLKYFKSITLILSIAKIRDNCILEIAKESKFVKYRALENNQLYGTLYRPSLKFGWKLKIWSLGVHAGVSGHLLF